MPLNLSAIADLEWLLREGAEPFPLDASAERAVAERVRSARGIAASDVHQAVTSDRGFRQALALAWLEAVEQRRPELPGARIEHGLSLVRWLLVLFGLLSGVGAAKALLAYDGTAPVNVLPFVACFFLLQILLLVLMVWFFVRARRTSAAPGLPHRLIAWMAQRFSGKGAEVVDAVRSLRQRRGLYVDVERWTLFTLAQCFGVAFNFGALVIAVHAGVFTDLTFGWSTTLRIEPGTLHQVVRGLSLPWSWFDSAVPTAEAVQASQWARMPGAFVAGTAPEQALVLAEQWWRFSITGLLVYGLLPRLAALLGGQRLKARAIAVTRFDHAAYQRLFDRLLPRGSGWQGPDAAAVAGPTPGGGRAPTEALLPAPRGAAVAVVVWGSLASDRDQVAARVARHMHMAVGGAVVAGGAALEGDAAAIARLCETDAARVAFAVAAGHQPTADVRDFLRGLRATLGSDKPVVVALLDADEGEQQAWRRSLLAFDDPYLWVERLEAVT